MRLAVPKSFARRRPAGVAVVLMAAALGSCHSNSTPVGAAVAASLVLGISPNPVVTVESSATGPTFSVRFTTTITEVAGLGGTVQLVSATLFDDATGLLLARNDFDSSDLLVFVGSKRVESKGSLDVTQELSYVATAKKTGSLTVEVRMTDDHGNNITSAILVKVI
jgi:hypothetical protein